MQGFQIGGKVVDSLGVQELADHKGGLQRSYGGQVMSHSRIIIMLVVQMICIPPPDVCQQFGVCLQIPHCQLDRKPLRPGNILLPTGLETRGYKTHASIFVRMQGINWRTNQPLAARLHGRGLSSCIVVAVVGMACGPVMRESSMTMCISNQRQKRQRFWTLVLGSLNST